MASSKDYLEYVLELLKEVEGITYKKMMGEYMLYKDGILFGGIYDNRFLVKQTKSAKELMPDAMTEVPYEKAKEMLLVENIEDKEFLSVLFHSMADELPEPKKRKSCKG